MYYTYVHAPTYKTLLITHIHTHTQLNTEVYDEMDFTYVDSNTI